MGPDNDRIAEAFDTVFDTMVEPPVESPDWDDIAKRAKNEHGPANVPVSRARWLGPSLGFTVMMVVLLIGGTTWLLRPAADDVSEGVAAANPPTASTGPVRWVLPSSTEGVEMTLTPAAVPAVPGEYEVEVSGSGDPIAFYACPKLQAVAVPDPAHENVNPHCEELPTRDEHTLNNPALPRVLSIPITEEMIDDGGVTIASMGGFGVITGTVVLEIDTTNSVVPAQVGCPAGSVADEPGPVDQIRPEPFYVENQAAVFDVASSRIVYLDAAGETWVFDVCANTWRNTHADTNLARPSGSLVYDIDSDKTISVGESAAVYDASTNMWRPASMPSSYDPGLPFSGDAVYDPDSGLIVAQHGQDPGLLVEYDVDADTWTTLGEVNEGAARFLVGYQAEINQLVFQGYTGGKKSYDGPSGMLVDPRSLEATPIITTNPPNVSGGFGTFTYATGTDTPYVHTDDQEICRLDPITQEWDVCFDTADGPGLQYGAFAAMVADPIHNRLLLIHGVYGTWWENANNDIWAIDLDTGEWIQLLANSG